MADKVFKGKKDLLDSKDIKENKENKVLLEIKEFKDLLVSRVLLVKME